MRRFYLVNEDGQKYLLQNGTTKVFLWTPAGLGFAHERDYMESEGFFFEMSHAVAQVPKTGVLVFHGKDPYLDYTAFMGFITKSKTLKLAYAPRQSWYYIDIDIESVEKTELQTDGTLQCEIIMMPKTPIYLPYEMNIDLSGDLAESIKQYSYDNVLDDYAYKYDYVYSNTAVAGEIEFEIPAQMNSGLEITIYGEISAPKMLFYANGEQIGEIDLTSISVQQDEYIRYSSIPLSAGVYLFADGVETDITEQVGLNADYPTFFLLPPNVTIKAVLQADTLAGTTAGLKVYEYFMSV